MTNKSIGASIFRNATVVSLALLIMVAINTQGFAFQSKKKKDLVGKVADSDGKPIAGARIVLAHKSWPNNRFRMKTYASRTNDDGDFVFRKQYYLNQNSGFLVTVVANGYVLTSDYLENPQGKELEPFEFELEKAIEKTLVFSKNGKPLGDSRVFVKSRTTTDGDEHFIYPISASKVTLNTDAEGKVKMNIFQSGDQAVLGFHKKGQVEDFPITIDASAEQTVSGTVESSNSSSSNNFSGTIRDTDGKLVADALVLLAHKTWPGGRFQMRTFAGKSDGDGNFVFEGLFKPGQRNGVLVSVLADGLTMASQYVMTEGDASKPFDFKLAKTKSKSLEFIDDNGEPIAAKRVILVSRLDSEGKEHIVYPASAGHVDLETDYDGRVSINYFEAGDEVEFTISAGGDPTRVKVRIDDSDSQSVSVKKKNRP